MRGGMRTLIALILVSAACRSVIYQPLASGTFVSDELNTEKELLGVELVLDLEGNRAVIRDGGKEIALTLTRIPDRKQWIDGCGTMTNYAMLEPVRIEPTAFEVRGRKFEYDHMRAQCYSPGVWLISLSGMSSARWIFSPPR